VLHLQFKSLVRTHVPKNVSIFAGDVLDPIKHKQKKKKEIKWSLISTFSSAKNDAYLFTGAFVTIVSFCI